MSFRFHPEAERELREAVEYYEDIEAGLRYDLLVEVYSAIQRAVAYPRAWPVLDGEIRRALVRRFPYGVLYAEQEGTLIIVAVMNLRRGRAIGRIVFECRTRPSSRRSYLARLMAGVQWR